MKSLQVSQAQETNVFNIFPRFQRELRYHYEDYRLFTLKV